MAGKTTVTYILGIFFMLLVVFRAAPAAAVPGGQTEPGGQIEEDPPPVGAEVFGQQGGYFHPFFFMEGKYTDNLYYTPGNRESEFITSFSPGLWIAVPPNREKLLGIHTSPTSPGGLRVSRMKPDTARRMQTYFLYTPSFVFYKNNSRHDHVDHRAEGLFQYNFDGGLSVDLMNQFNRRHEINLNVEERLDRYHDNLAALMLNYQHSEKLSLRADYANYWLDYADSANQFRNRMDNVLGFYVFHQTLPRTSFFAQYEFADINYDKNNIFGSREHRYHLGTEWQITAESRGRIKAGYMQKRFDDSEIGDEEGFSAEAQLQHNFTPRRAGTLSAYHRYTETSITESYAVLTTGADFRLMQRFDEKWSATLGMMYYRDEFRGEFTVGEETRERRDNTFQIGPALIFEPRDWMKMDVSYYFSKRDSNFDAFDFENNTVAVTLELAL